jgi:hypothetical protein
MGVASFPECVDPMEVRFGSPDLFESVQALVDQRTPLPARFKELPSPQEVQESSNPDRVLWCLFRHAHEPTMCDRIAGAPFYFIRMADWEGRHCKYADQVALDRRGRPLWSKSGYMKRFVHWQYQGQNLVRGVEYSPRGPESIEERRDTGTIEKHELHLGPEPIVTRLEWKGRRLVRARSRYKKKQVEDRKYQYQGGKASIVEVRQFAQIEIKTAAWLGIDVKPLPEPIQSGTDLAMCREILKQPWREPTYLKAGKAKGEVVGRFGAPLEGTEAPVCPGCLNPMVCLLQVGKVSAWWCEACSYCHGRQYEEGALFVDLSDWRRPRVISKLQREKESSPARKRPSPRPAVAAPPGRIEFQTYHKLGGYPMWIQSGEWPRCVKCRGVPSFWGQIGADGSLGYEFGDAGVVYLFWCAGCRVTAALEQCF